MLEIIECPRDAMQGIKRPIPAAVKIDYINALLKAGFNTIDFGSFVSPKAVPQMADTREVLSGLSFPEKRPKLLAIVANLRGAEEAASFDEIDVIGYPFSVSETFQQRNTNAGIEESLKRTEAIAEAALSKDKELVIYLSMAFGNPYGDPWSPEITAGYARQLYELFDVKIMALSDTVGSSEPNSIHQLFSQLIPEIPEVNFGAHLHTTPDAWEEKIHAAYEAGCRRFDGALKGYGGCPMAADDLTGNMPTEKMLQYFADRNIDDGVNREALASALLKAGAVFG